MKKDTVYASQLDRVAPFEFDARVADVFENMITRSVPGYTQVLELIGVIAGRYGKPDSRCYDLGCSLGASTLMMRRNLPHSCHVVGIDNSTAMVERCRANIARDHSEATVEIQEASIQETRIERASLVVMNYTLQFIPLAERAAVIANICDGMLAGGALVLSEKIRFEDNETQTLMTDLHHAFKRQQGYSDLEIAQKRTALENVLVPETEAEHIDRLLNAGFGSARLLTRCINFSTFIAVK